MVTARRALGSALWSSLETGGLALLSLVSLIVFARLLEPREIGAFAVCLAIVEMVGVVVTMLFHDALVQKREVDNLDYNTAFTSTLVISAVAITLCVGLAQSVANWIGEPDIAPILSWMSLCFPLSGASATIIARQRREFAFDKLAKRSLIGRLCGALVGIAFAFGGAGVWSLVAQQVTMVGLSSLILWFLSTSRPTIGFNFARCRSLLKFGLPSIGVQMLNFALKRIFIILIGFYLGVREAGFVNLAFRTIDTLWSFSIGAIQQVILPVLSRLQDDPERLRRAYRSVVALSCLILYPVFLGFASVSPEAVEVLFGASWLPSAAFMATLASIALIQVPRVFVLQMLIARGKPQDLLPSIIACGLVLAVAIGVHGIPNGSWAIGLWLCAEIVQTPFASYRLKRRMGLGMGDQLQGVWLPLGASVAMVAVVFGLHHTSLAEWPAIQRLIIFVLAGAIVYCSIILVFGRKTLRETVMLIKSAMARGTDAAPARPVAESESGRDATKPPKALT